mmetsp:Transcript_34576/g.83852  ORF Transcript_34576/g.83852 Transcript_34576/m.83852 type:complete len:129 (-) Transcript_34576:1000-1386(-)
MGTFIKSPPCDMWTCNLLCWRECHMRKTPTFQDTPGRFATVARAYPYWDGCFDVSTTTCLCREIAPMLFLDFSRPAFWCWKGGIQYLRPTIPFRTLTRAPPPRLPEKISLDRLELLPTKTEHKVIFNH